MRRGTGRKSPTEIGKEDEKYRLLGLVETMKVARGQLKLLRRVEKEKRLKKRDRLKMKVGISKKLIMIFHFFSLFSERDRKNGGHFHLTVKTEQGERN